MHHLNGYPQKSMHITSQNFTLKKNLTEIIIKTEKRTDSIAEGLAWVGKHINVILIFRDSQVGKINYFNHIHLLWYTKFLLIKKNTLLDRTQKF